MHRAGKIQAFTMLTKYYVSLSQSLGFYHRQDSDEAL